jgi:hypothetical protein
MVRDSSQARGHRAHGVVLLRPRVAEIDQHAIADIARDEAVPAAHDARARIAVAADRVGEVLGIEFERQPGGADQVAEHHRQLAPLDRGPCTSFEGRIALHARQAGAALRTELRPARRCDAAGRARQAVIHGEAPNAGFLIVMGSPLFR